MSKTCGSQGSRSSTVWLGSQVIDYASLIIIIIILIINKIYIAPFPFSPKAPYDSKKKIEKQKKIIIIIIIIILIRITSL